MVRVLGMEAFLSGWHYDNEEYGRTDMELRMAAEYHNRERLVLGNFVAGAAEWDETGPRAVEQVEVRVAWNLVYIVVDQTCR